MYGKKAHEIMKEAHALSNNDHPLKFEDSYHFPMYSEEVAYEPIYEEDPIVATNIVRLRQRSAEGMQKYGTTMMRDDLTAIEWIDHAIEEALDFANYLEALKRKMKRDEG